MDQTTMTGEPPMTGAPQKKGWGWLKWTLLGCGGLLAIVLVIGSLATWFLYRNFSMTTEPAKAEAAAQEILRFEKPEGYKGLMAGSMMGMKMAVIGSQKGEESQRGMIMFMTMPEAMATDEAERQLRDAMQRQDRNGGQETRDPRPGETFKVRGKDVATPVTLIETNSKKTLQYTLTLKETDHLTLMMIIGPEESTTHDWVQNFLNTVK